MSHEIDFSNNRANMAYVGKTPWHGLGQVMDENAGIDQWRVAAGLDWEIEKRAVFHGIIDNDGKKRAQVVDKRHALVRNDTQECLSIMSDKYQIVQPGEILEFYRELVETSDRFTIETAGSLYDGKKIWALARGNTELRVMGQDVIKPYLLLATSCDGSMSTTAQFTSVRVVCNNTLSLSVGQGKRDAIRVPHSGKFDATAVRAELGLIDGRFDSFAETVDTLARTSIDDETAVNYFAALYGKFDEHGDVLESNKKNLERIVNRCMKLYKTGPGAEFVSAQGSLWGAVNAVTRFEDFDAQSRSVNNRFNSSQFGKGAALKNRAVDNALTLAQVA